MIYILLVAGLIIIICGWYLQIEQNKSKREIFKEIIVEEQKENGEYLNLMANHLELKSHLSTLEDKLDRVMDHMENFQESEAIEKMTQALQEITIEEQVESEPEPEQTIIEEVEYPKIEHTLPQAYQEVAKAIEEMEKQNKTIEEIAAGLDMGKGEVLFLKNLSKK